MEYKYELHCHTGAVSRCGRVEPEKIVEMYVEAGYNGIVVTDHYSPMTFPIHRLACPQKAADFYLSGYRRMQRLISFRFRLSKNRYVSNRAECTDSFYDTAGT